MTAASKPALPDGIEIFRAGTRRADNGRDYTITTADLAAAAAAYDPARHEAPLVVGHPEHNLPAYGWVAGLQVVGDALVASHRQVEPAFAEMVAAGRFKKRSAAFYAPTDPSNPAPGTWYLRHVGYLGAQPPAVKGLKDIQFAQAADAVCFSDPVSNPQEQSTMTQKTAEQLQAELDAANRRAAEAEAQARQEKTRADQAESQVANFGEQTRQQRHAANVAFCEAQVKAGRLLPKDQARAVAVLNTLAASEPVEFTEGGRADKVSPLEWVKALIEGAKPKVQFGEHAPGNAGDVVDRGAARGKSDAEIDQAARQYMRQHANVNYAEAVAAVTSFEA